MNKINDEFTSGAEHFRQSKFYKSHGRKVNNRLKGLYRSREGKFLGVCKGLAERFDLPVAMIRLMTVMAAIFTGFFFILFLYIILALFMDTEPSTTYSSNSEYASNYRLKDLLDRSEHLAKRVEDMEAKVTKNNKSWEERLYNK